MRAKKHLTWPEAECCQLVSLKSLKMFQFRWTLNVLPSTPSFLFQQLKNKKFLQIVLVLTDKC